MFVKDRHSLTSSVVGAEALHIFDWWAQNMPDPLGGGFYGEIDEDGIALPDADKGAVLNTRLLWFFSAIARNFGHAEGLVLAKRAYDYLLSHFVDMRHGGIYWSVDHRGRVRDSRKQAYAQSFCVYALAEYYVASGDDAALDLARWLQGKLEHMFWDADRGGYIEALSPNWSPVEDQRLSEKDIDAPKTMNTHLHVLEAYTRLHQVAPDGTSEATLHRAIDVFLDHFAGEDGHLRLFFDRNWRDLTRSVSYGHDIEASWLIWEAVETLGNPALIERARPVVVALARTALAEGMMANGGLAYERDFNGHLDPDGEWWEQAEGLVGFTNAFQLTGDPAYREACERLWGRIKSAYGAGRGSEWTWYADDARRPGQPLASLWKCPYHNGRAMLELIKRLS